MPATPYIESESKQPVGGTAYNYIFSRGVKGLVRTSKDNSQIFVFLSFPDTTDLLTWEPKRVLPLLQQFGAQAVPSIDSWALQIPASVAQQALQEIDAVIGERRFYA
ncbi:hypothetical protein [Lysobacter sp. Root604]|uniref:hypothetical protein n=1 Tax=Lysobacter sp. Root604 TaxID=1736568 RepID=UPI0006FAF2AA|nr:hypothetical protein [Lysobacter sp. Root604]KRA20810.1 hypothetical protein ASD69_05760 [Lysobacter sp. Root604]